MEEKPSTITEDLTACQNKISQKLSEIKKAISGQRYLSQKSSLFKNQTTESFFSISNSQLASKTIVLKNRNSSNTHRSYDKENLDINAYEGIREEGQGRSFRTINKDYRYDPSFGSFARKASSNKALANRSNVGQKVSCLYSKNESSSLFIKNQLDNITKIVPEISGSIVLNQESKTRNEPVKKSSSFLPVSFQKQIDLSKTPSVLKTLHEKQSKENKIQARSLGQSETSMLKFKNMLKNYKKECQTDHREKLAIREKTHTIDTQQLKAGDNVFRTKLTRLFEKTTDRKKNKQQQSAKKLTEDNDRFSHNVWASRTSLQKDTPSTTTLKLLPPSETLNSCFPFTPDQNQLETSLEIKRSTSNENPILFITAETNKGTTRDTNEDRISIVLNINYSNAEKFNYFSIYDGHAGSACSEYLKENLHRIITNDSNLFENFESRIKHHFQDLDNLFLKQCDLTKETAGSCALALLTYKNTIYIANTGDSRAFMSTNSGRKIVNLSIDHKPELESEKVRIFRNGGYLYCTSTQIFKENEQKVMNGPIRVYPGRLTTSRSFGDIEAKYEKYGGLEGVLIVEPEVFSFPSDEADFAVMGSDGLYEQLSNSEIASFIWQKLLALKEAGVGLDQNSANQITEDLIQFAMESQSMDNISAVILFFKNCTAL
jgi:serine/threonine protein phosphatase PrpC